MFKITDSRIMLYILAFATLAVNTPLSIVGILVEISKYFNISIAFSGLFVSSFTYTIALTGLFLPLIFKRFERKTVFISIFSIFVISSLISIFTNNLLISLICRILPAIFYSSFVSIALTVAEEIAPKGLKQDYVTKILLGISIGSIIGLPITTAIGTLLGYKAVMLWLSIINFIPLILICGFPRMPNLRKSNPLPYNLLKSKKYIVSFIGIIMYPIGISIIYNYMSYFFQTVNHIYTYNLSLILFVYGLISIFGTGIYGKLLKNKPRFAIFSVSIIGIITLILLYKFARIKIYAVILMMIIGILDGAGYTVMQYIERRLLPESPELANGIFLSILNGGIAIGTSIGGFLVNDFGVMSIFLGAIFPLILSFILLYLIIPKSVYNS
ncbi:MAG: MFS transporter [Methanobrevibacter wolinii]|nr:MFS transporter [Methanobrevibacter wolinii]